jgi:hypothetical protein
MFASRPNVCQDLKDDLIIFADSIHCSTILVNMSQKFDSVSLNPSDQRSTSRTPCFNVPFDRDTDFVHRPNITGGLKETYTGPSSRMALVGLGGLG